MDSYLIFFFHMYPEFNFFLKFMEVYLQPIVCYSLSRKTVEKRHGNAATILFSEQKARTQAVTKTTCKERLFQNQGLAMQRGVQMLVKHLPPDSLYSGHRGCRHSKTDSLIQSSQFNQVEMLRETTPDSHYNQCKNYTYNFSGLLVFKAHCLLLNLILHKY